MSAGDISKFVMSKHIYTKFFPPILPTRPQQYPPNSSTFFPIFPFPAFPLLYQLNPCVSQSLNSIRCFKWSRAQGGESPLGNHLVCAEPCTFPVVLPPNFPCDDRNQDGVLYFELSSLQMCDDEIFC